MKKNIFVFTLIFGLALSSCSFSESPSNETIETSHSIVNTEYDGQLFDSDRTHMPSEEDINRLKDRLKSNDGKLPFQDVIDILGKPHEPGTTSGMITLSWTTEESHIYWIYVGIDSSIMSEDDKQNMDLEEQIFTYGVATHLVNVDSLYRQE